MELKTSLLDLNLGVGVESERDVNDKNINVHALGYYITNGS